MELFLESSFYYIFILLFFIYFILLTFLTFFKTFSLSIMMTIAASFVIIQKSQRDMSGKTCCYFHNDTFCHRNFGHRSTHSQWSQTRICTLCVDTKYIHTYYSYNNVSIIPTTYQHYLHFLRTGLVPTPSISVDASMSQHIVFVCVAI